ncbi:glycoside hydrolase family 32 protein [Salegentibacter sp. Hel_I_6]|uniref:glycoside hydrolase family 32 protein n=1 Tax=Salegentibacter sp. Hel_I_6 TaxID=1250278 RepID=UPI0005662435|nr:glycoside hydrolase family 32 protein [Salegentibacter sp. Hel_I_6]
MKNKLIILSSCFLSLMLMFSCKENNKESDEETLEVTAQSDTDFRPAFHFTPEENWMNDPNGMFFLNGTYHLFFQYYPEGNTWGPMHWGHATSKDMIKWEEQPIALEPDEQGYIFSGSAVVDTENTSGFGDGETPPVIAMFTYHDPKGEEEGREDYQTQAIAYSLDEGKTFTKYEGNPVIENPGIRDFRDPKITRDNVHDQWIMVLSADDQTMFYTSQNLKDWELASEFGRGIGAHGGVWECPDFIQMKVEDSDEKKWVLIQSLNPGGYNGGSGTQYFVGDFDGKTFTLDESMQDLDEDHPYWLDFGKDNYAGVTWANIPEEDGRHLFIGWMSNWQYANEVPTETWRSAMTIARELKLTKTEDTYRVISSPVSELEDYKGEEFTKNNIEVEGETQIVASEEIDLANAVLSFEIENLKQQEYHFSLSNDGGDILKFGYDHKAEEFYIDRSNSGLTDFNENFGDKVSKAPRLSKTSNLKVKAIIDNMSIELFFDNGETVMTEIFFPEQPLSTFSAEGKNFSINNLKINQVKLN